MRIRRNHVQWYPRRAVHSPGLHFLPLRAAFAPTWRFRGPAHLLVTCFLCFLTLAFAAAGSSASFGRASLTLSALRESNFFEKAKYGAWRGAQRCGFRSAYSAYPPKRHSLSADTVFEAPRLAPVSAPAADPWRRGRGAGRCTACTDACSPDRCGSGTSRRTRTGPCPAA